MIDDTELVNSLLERGILDQDTLKSGVERAKKSARPLYETLIFGRFIDEAPLVALVGELIDVPTRDVNASAIPADVRELVPSSLARRNRILPIALEGDELTLGMVDPSDELAIDEIAMHAGVIVRPVLVGPASLAEAIDQVYGAIPDSSDALSSFDEIDVQSMMDEMMAGNEWSELFSEDDDVSVEDSAVLSMEMRDRPSTDVLNDADLEDSEAEEDSDVDDELLEDLNSPALLTAPYASLDDWDVDEAIERGDSQILSATSAEEFFRPETGARRARLDEGAGDEEAVGDETPVHAPKKRSSSFAGGEADGPSEANTAPTRARVAAAAFELPDDVNAEGLALALMNLLAERGILRTEDALELARRLSKLNER